MNIKVSYTISQSLFTDIYRSHCHYKFRIRRSLFLSICLLIFGIIMEKVYLMDFAWINSIAFLLVIISFICNVVCDYILPKTAYKTMVEQKMDKGRLTICEDGLIFGDEPIIIKKEWHHYDTCIETKHAFLLYQKDNFTILCKECFGDELDSVRLFLKEKVNKGKPIKLKY